MTTSNSNREERRKVVTTWVVTELVKGEVWYMCRTNWSKGYTAGVLEYKSEQAALDAAKAKGVKNPELRGWNEFGERIL